MLKILIYSNYILATAKTVDQTNVLKSLQTKGVMLFIKFLSPPPYWNTNLHCIAYTRMQDDPQMSKCGLKFECNHKTVTPTLAINKLSLALCNLDYSQSIKDGKNKRWLPNTKGQIQRLCQIAPVGWELQTQRGIRIYTPQFLGCLE